MSLSILKGLHRRALGISRFDQIIGRSGFVAGGEDRPAVGLPGPDTVYLFDDFLGDLLDASWAYVTGDTGAVSTGALSTGSGGIFRLQSEAIPLNVPGENFALTQGLFKNWKGNMGPGGKENYLRMVARVKAESYGTTAKRQHIFVGFGDSGGAEFPAYDTGGGIISAASDLVGFAYSPAGSTLTAGKWSLVATATDVDQSASSGVTPTNNVYDELEIEITSGPSNAGGIANFYINGKSVGRITSPVAMTVAMTPWIGHWIQDTGARYLDVDYVSLSASRDTGL